MAKTTKAIDRLPIKEMLAQLIEIPSISSVNSEFDMGNEQVIDQLADWLHDLGFMIEKLLVSDSPAKYNLIARSRDGDDGLILAGHTDTVPCNPNLWNSDPFSLLERDEKFFGLGSSDMKGFFPLVIGAVRNIDLQKLDKPLIILATADEESTMSGAKALVETKQLRAKYAVIGEPTGLQPIRMHKGVMMESISVHGRSGHSSNPALGHSALEGMNKVISELLLWRSELQSKYSEPLFEVNVPTMNLGHIHGGDNPNRICGDCELQIDLRILPGMDNETLRADLNQRVVNVLKETELTYDLRSLINPVPAFETSADSPVVTATEEYSGRRAGSVAFATEGPFMDSLGIETVIFGAGDIDQAHQPDEFVALDQLEPTINILENLIHHFCVEHGKC